MVNANKVGIFVQARLGSTRLPGKALYPFASKTVLTYLLDRLKESFPDATLKVLTSNEIEDQALKFYLESQGFKCLSYDIDQNDVLERFYLAAEASEVDTIVRLTGDNPLLDISFLKSSLLKHIEQNLCFSSTRIIEDKKVKRFSPKGNTFDIFKRSCLVEVREGELSEYDREHVIPAMYAHFNCEVISYYKFSNKDDVEDLSIDTSSDYIAMSKLISEE